MTDPNTPRVDVSVDKSSLATELKTANPIAITIKGAGGFSGAVGLTATVVDGSGAALAGWTVDLSAASVSLAANGTANAMATVHVPSLSSSLTGTLKISSTSSATAGAKAASVAITAANQVTFAVKYNAAIGDCDLPADGGTPNNPVTIARTTKVRFFNTGAGNIVIHVTDSNNGGTAGQPITHQGQGPNGNADSTTEPNTAYEQTPIGAGTAEWYCHSTPSGGGNPPKGGAPTLVVQ